MPGCRVPRDPIICGYFATCHFFICDGVMKYNPDDGYFYHFSRGRDCATAVGAENAVEVTRDEAYKIRAGIDLSDVLKERGKALEEKE